MAEEKTVDTLHEELLEHVDDSYQKTEGFPVWDILRAFSFGLKKLWDKVFLVESKLNVDNLTGADLERFVSQRKGLSRKAATAANGYITIISGTGTITEGDIFATSGNIRFKATETKEVSNGDTVAIEAVEAGASGNVAANTITEMPVTIEGIAQITNPNITDYGYDAETDNSLRERYYEALREPATSGNIYHYKQWAKSVSGVGDAKIFPLWAGDNTVQVVIIDDTGAPAIEELVDTVQEYIDPNSSGTGEGQAPIGAYCTVVSAEPLTVNVSSDITLEDGYTIETVKESIEAAIDSYLKTIRFNYNFVSAAKICDIVLTTAGVADCENFTANGSFTRITIPEKSVPVLGEVTLNVA